MSMWSQLFKKCLKTLLVSWFHQVLMVSRSLWGNGLSYLLVTKILLELVGCRMSPADPADKCRTIFTYFREIIECPTATFWGFFPRSQVFSIKKVSVVWTKQKTSILIILSLLSKENKIIIHKIRVLGFIFNTCNYFWKDSTNSNSIPDSKIPNQNMNLQLLSGSL